MQLFFNKQSLHRSLSRADTHLSKSPHKRQKYPKKLFGKYQVKFQFEKGASVRPRKDFNEEKRNWLKKVS